MRGTESNGRGPPMNRAHRRIEKASSTRGAHGPSWQMHIIKIQELVDGDRHSARHAHRYHSTTRAPPCPEHSNGGRRCFQKRLDPLRKRAGSVVCGSSACVDITATRVRCCQHATLPSKCTARQHDLLYFEMKCVLRTHRTGVPAVSLNRGLMVQHRPGRGNRAAAGWGRGTISIGLCSDQPDDRRANVGAASQRFRSAMRTLLQRPLLFRSVD
jgi:hypothetical protein